MIKYILKYKLKLLIYVLLTAAVAVLTAYFPFVIKDLVNIGLDKNFDLLINQIGISFLVIALTLVFEYFRQISHYNLVKEWSLNLRDDLFYKIINRNHKVFNKNNSSKYVSLLTNDIHMIKTEYFYTVTSLIQTIIQLIVYSYALFVLSFYIAISVILLSVLPLLIPKFTEKKLSAKKKKYSSALENYTVKIKDVFNGFEVVKSFNITKHVNKDFNFRSKEVEDSAYRFTKYRTGVNIASGFCTYLITFATLSIGAFLLVQGRITAGAFVAAINLMEVVSMPIRDVVYQVINFKAIKPINNKILSYIYEQIRKEKGRDKHEFKNNIKMENISFSYENDVHVLKNINLEIKRNKKYAIVGQSGSGKSTLLKILLRYYENFDGCILMDDIRYEEIKLSSIYKLMSSIQQNIFMFDSTIEDNICLYSNYSKTQIENAISLSGLSNTISRFDKGINSLVGENGNKLSGGEKQRISIARALIRNSPIFVFDEATSSLDKETSFQIEDSILNIPNKTALVVTHKLNKTLLKRYDSIIVMKDGEIKEMNNFDNLMKSKGYFYNLFNVENMEDNSRCNEIA